jgi:4-diphosphocytidyl-2-C-methyl-D-erythritol kinase
LIVKPPLDISTRRVYDDLDLMRHKTAKIELTNRTYNADNITLLLHAVRNVEIKRESGLLNDLEAVVVKNFPVIAEIKDRLLREGSMFSMMSGSGSAVFGVFKSMKEAERVSGIFSNCWTAVTRTITDGV